MDLIHHLIVEPHLDSRMILRAALQHAGVKGDFLSTGSFIEASAIMERRGDVSLVFLSYRLDAEALGAFVKVAKEKFYGRDTAFIGTLPSDASPTTISVLVLLGLDGCLIEPYSVQALEGVLDLAEKVKQQRREARLRFALRLLAREILDQQGYVAEMKSRGYPAELSLRILHEMASVLKELEPEGLAIYYQELAAASADNPGQAGHSDSYRGPSQRVRSREVARNFEEIKAALRAVG